MSVRKGDVVKAPAVEDRSSLLKDSLPGLSIEDLNLPKSIVTRIAKSILPPNTQIQANALLGMSKSATLFINYIASQANENAAAANRKTVNPSDVFGALEDSQFAEWKPRLQAELQKYTEIVGQRKEKSRSKDVDGAPVAKKIKRDRSSTSLSDDNTKNHDNDQEENEPTDHEKDDLKDSAGNESDESDESDDQITENEREEANLDEDEQDSIPMIDEALDNGDDSD